MPTATKGLAPLAVRLDEKLLEQLDTMNDRYPLFSRNQIIRAAIDYYLTEAIARGVDASLQPLPVKKGHQESR